MSAENNKRGASSPLCKGKVTKFSKVDDLAQIEKIVGKRLVNNEIDKIKRVGLATLNTNTGNHQESSSMGQTAPRGQG